MIRFLALLFMFTALSRPAYAYIDAALGGLVLQSLAAGFVSFMMIWRVWVYKVKSFFGKKQPEEASANEQANQGE